MTREEYIRNLIKLTGKSVKSFSHSIDIPYTTLLSMLKSGMGGASVDNVIKVCNGLKITVEDLQKVIEEPTEIIPFYTNEFEQELILKYREKPQMQNAVNTLLDLEK